MPFLSYGWTTVKRWQRKLLPSPGLLLFHMSLLGCTLETKVSHCRTRKWNVLASRFLTVEEMEAQIINHNMTTKEHHYGFAASLSRKSSSKSLFSWIPCNSWPSSVHGNWNDLSTQPTEMLTLTLLDFQMGSARGMAKYIVFILYT